MKLMKHHKLSEKLLTSSHCRFSATTVSHLTHIPLLSDTFLCNCIIKHLMPRSWAEKGKWPQSTYIQSALWELPLLCGDKQYVSACWVDSAMCVWVCVVSLCFRVRVCWKLWPLLSVPYSVAQYGTLLTDPEMDHTHHIYSFGWISGEQPLWTCWTMTRWSASSVSWVLFFFFFPKMYRN